MFYIYILTKSSSNKDNEAVYKSFMRPNPDINVHDIRTKHCMLRYLQDLCDRVDHGSHVKVPLIFVRSSKEWACAISFKVKLAAKIGFNL